MDEEVKAKKRGNVSVAKLMAMYLNDSIEVAPRIYQWQVH